MEIAPISEPWGPYPFKPVCQVQWDQTVTEAVDKIAEDNPYLSYKPGDEVSALEFINWINGAYGQDIRPKLFDNITKSYVLFDTGAMKSCVPKLPSDKINKNFTLRTANGQPMPTYGYRQLSIRIGRKNYDIQAVITDVKQNIIGMDFIHTHKLGFEFFDDLFLVDKKAQIKQKLKFTTVLHNSLPTVKEEFRINRETEKSLFELTCMQQLTEIDEQKQDISAKEMEKLEEIPEFYRNLIKKLDILTPTIKLSRNIP